MFFCKKNYQQSHKNLSYFQQKEVIMIEPIFYSFQNLLLDYYFICEMKTFQKKKCFKK